MDLVLTAPQTAQIPLAKQPLIRVQYNRPDFYNGMKTWGPSISWHRATPYNRPDFYNGMKTQLASWNEIFREYNRPDFYNGMKTHRGIDILHTARCTTARTFITG